MRRFTILIALIITLAALQLRYEHALPAHRALSVSFLSLTGTPNDDLDPTWSPDGTRVAFVGHHEGNPEVYTLDLATNHLRNLSNSAADSYEPAWSPDGKFLIFRERERHRVDDLWMANTQTGALTLMADGIDAYDHTLTWSADGQRVFFWSLNALYVYDITTAARATLFESDSSFGVAMSPGGDFAALFLYRAHLILLLDVVNVEVRPITEREVTGGPVWSRDGQWLAYTTGDQHSVSRLQIFNLRSGVSRTVFASEPGAINLWGWSTENRLAFTTTQADQPPALYALEFSPWLRAREILRFDHAIRSGAWSPVAGNHFAFATYGGLYVVDIHSGAFSNLIYGRGYVLDFQWSPDGAYLTARYTGSFSRMPEMAVANLRTGDTILVLENGLREIKWSPDSARIAYVGGSFRQTDLRLMTLGAN